MASLQTFSFMIRSAHRLRRSCHLIQRASLTLSHARYGTDEIITFPKNRASENFGSLAESSLENPSLAAVLPPSKFKTLSELDDNDGESEHFAKIADIYRPAPLQFERKIEQLLESRDLAGALKVFDEQMADERVSPMTHTYKLLIHACGKAGYAPKAAAILKRFRSGGQVPSFDMYADVFNACAKAPKDEKSTTIALTIAHGIRKNLNKLIQEPLPLPLYHTMIGAFGQCGDLDTAFAIFDEIPSKGIALTSETFCHLLHACISDKESGFRLALVVYRRLLQQKKLNPDVHVFNLLLRATRDCGIGDGKVANDILIEAMTSHEARKFLEGNERKLLESPKNEVGLEEGTISAQSTRKTSHLILTLKSKNGAIVEREPNLLERRPFLDNVSGLDSDLSTPRKRFQLFGDLDGFIAATTGEYKARLDIKTFSLLLCVIDNTVEAEIELFDSLRSLQITPDVGFFNQLIRRRVARYDYDSAKAVLDMMSQYDLSPDIVTFGVLSMACKRPGEILKVLDDMKALNVRPNVIIMTNLLRLAGRFKRPYHVSVILQELNRYKIQPDHVMVGTVEKFYHSYQKTITDIERKTNQKPPHRVIVEEIEKNGLKNWMAFCTYYDEWLRKVKVTLPEHPWNQYKTRKDTRQF